MPIGIAEEHVALQDAVRGWMERHCPPAVPRALLDATEETLPPFWSELAAQGWLGLHVDEAHGGSGYGVLELAVVLEELGRALAPGPILPTMLAASVIAMSTNETARGELLPRLVNGDAPGALGGGEGCGLVGEETADALRVSGSIRAVLGAHLAAVVVVPVSVGDAAVWVALEGDAVDVRELPSVDSTRRVAEVTVDSVLVGPGRRLDGVSSQQVVDLVATLTAAELVGVAQWAVDTAAAYAKERVQFGRPIGQFQGVKHKCADMVCRVELARAAAWDAAGAVSDPETST